MANWLMNQFAAAEAAVRKWPRWKLREAGIDHLFPEVVMSEVFTFITADNDGRCIENTAEMVRGEGELRINLKSAVDLSSGLPCKPCSAEQFAEWLNTISENNKGS